MSDGIDLELMQLARHRSTPYRRRLAIAIGYPNGIGLLEGITFQGGRPYRIKRLHWWWLGSVIDTIAGYELNVWTIAATSELHFESIDEWTKA